MSRQHDRPDRNRMRVAPSKKNAPRGSIEHDEVHAEWRKRVPPDSGEEARDGGHPLGIEYAQLDQNRGSAYPADDVDRAMLVRVAHHIKLPVKRAAVQPRHERADPQYGRQHPFIEQAYFPRFLSCKHKQHRAERRLNA